MTSPSSQSTPCEPDQRIVVVDDDPVVRRLLERLLEHAGYGDVVAIGESRRLTECWSQLRPDVVLLDLHMPQPDGLAVLRAIRAREQRDDDWVPVIMLTGDSSEHQRRAALEAGATDFVVKPFDATELRLRVRNALAMRNHHSLLEQRVRTRTRELEMARLEVLQRLALTAEFRDDETHQHTERVGRIAGLLAQALVPAQAETIRLAAPLHDIGKVGIPDAVLLKRERLTEGEWEAIKQHPSIGKRILEGSASPVLQCAEAIAHAHHERWDGAGYPRGLRGADIPISARITAVADAFDALTHERPYRAPVPVEEAVAEIVRCSGTQFDPDVVDAFAALPRRVLLSGG